MSGYFIALEGLDGSGKTTMGARLASALRRLGCEVVSAREPGGTEIGEGIRGVLFGATGGDMLPETEALLFAAARAQLVGEVIRPGLARGAIVLTDRFADSSRAYQGGGRGLPRDLVQAMQELATGGLEPDLKLLLDVRPETALARRRGDVQRENRLDREALDFYGKVRDEYLALAAAEPERWRIIDAARPRAQVWASTWQEVVASGIPLPPTRVVCDGEEPLAT